MTPSTNDANYPERTTLAGLPDDDYFGEGKGRIRDTDLAAWLGRGLDALRVLLADLYGQGNLHGEPIVRDGVYFLTDIEALIVTGRLVGDDDGEAGKAFPALSKAISDRRFVRPDILGEDRLLVGALPRHDVGDGVPRVLATKLAEALGYEPGPYNSGLRFILRVLNALTAPGQGQDHPRLCDHIIQGDSGDLPDALLSVRDALATAANVRTATRQWLAMDPATRPQCWWLPVAGQGEMFVREQMEGANR